MEQSNPAVLGPVQRQVRPHPERATFEAWALPILGDNLNWRESGDCELAWQAWQAARPKHADDHWDRVGAHAERLREALRRLRAWGGLGNRSYSATVAFGVTDWIDAGMLGELPELPEYAVRPNVELTGLKRPQETYDKRKERAGRFGSG